MAALQETRACLSSPGGKWIHMTYCVAVSVKEGLVFCSDSRTSAGVDQIRSYSKMHRFSAPGERQLVMMTAGNLATSQAILRQIAKDIKNDAKRNLLNLDGIIEVANYVGEMSVAQQEKFQDSKGAFEVSIILGGQIKGAKPRIVLIYPEGNNITSSDDTPYLQIGESKYGKPILDRILTSSTKLETAALCTLVSMDSTIRSNLTVGPPVELTLYKTDSLELFKRQRFKEDSEYFRHLHKAWDQHLKEAFTRLPPLAWADNWDDNSKESELPDAQNEF